MKPWTKIENINKNQEISNFDLLNIAQILNPEILTFTDDVANRYTYSDLNLINLIKTTFMKNLDKIVWKLKDSIHQTLEGMVISVEKDWSHLLKIRDLAQHIRAKMTDVSVLIVEKNSLRVGEKTYSEGKKKVYGTNLLLDTLFGIEQRDIKQKELQLDQLAQVWVYLVFKYAQPITKNWIEHFMFDTQIYSITWKDYFKIEAEAEWRILGLYVPSLNKNFKFLCDMLDELSNDERWWINYAEFKSKWLEFKNNVLNKQIILTTINENIDKDALLKGVKHIIADQIDAREYEYEDLKKRQQIPTRNQILDLPIHIKATYWTNENKDFVYIITCTLFEKEIGDIVVELGWQQFSPTTSMKSKLKFQNFNVDSLSKT